MKKKYRIHKDDKVMILVGKDKGKIGRVLRIYSKKDKVLIEKVNMIKRHTKGNPYRQQAAGIIEKEAPIAISNVQLVCNACTKSTRVGYRFTQDGKKVRFCKKCNEII